MKNLDQTIAKSISPFVPPKRDMGTIVENIDKPLSKMPRASLLTVITREIVSNEILQEVELIDDTVVIHTNKDYAYQIDTCGGEDLIDWVSKDKGMSFGEANRWLADCEQETLNNIAKEFAMDRLHLAEKVEP